jgi:DNA-directed RNA polymerase subunit L
MNPTIDNVSSNEILTFTLSGVNYSIANALRRTILSDIPTVVFKTAPHSENDATILVNTSRLTNEIIKHRLSGIPIHITDFEQFPLKDCILEVNVENTTDSVIYVTTRDFKIKNALTNSYLKEELTREIFPPDAFTNDFIIFARLRPKFSDELPGEKLHLTCKFSIDTSKHNGMYVVASKCSYGFTVDTKEMENTLQQKIQDWKNDGKSADEINFEAENWKLLDGLRITKKNSFDFVIESVGVFENKKLVKLACDILNKELHAIHDLIEKDEISFEKSLNTMENSFDIRLENQDYTIGKTLEFILYETYFEKNPILSYCGFKKFHPHDNHSVIRLAYKDTIDVQSIKGHLKASIHIAIKIFDSIKQLIT